MEWRIIMNDIDVAILKMIDDYCQSPKGTEMKEILSSIELKLIENFIIMLKERDNNE